jgi:hypothetical protein
LRIADDAADELPELVVTELTHAEIQQLAAMNQRTIQHRQMMWTTR